MKDVLDGFPFEDRSGSVRGWNPVDLENGKDEE